MFVFKRASEEQNNAAPVLLVLIGVLDAEPPVRIHDPLGPVTVTLP